MTEDWHGSAQAWHTFRVVLDLTVHSLDRVPGTLLDGVEPQRPLVAGTDGVRSRPATVAMLPLAAPHVMEIDRSVALAAPDGEVEHVLIAVPGDAARSGAIMPDGAVSSPAVYVGLLAPAHSLVRLLGSARRRCPYET